MADYAFFIMFMWLVKGILIVLAIVALILLAWWIRASFHSRRARRSLLIFATVLLVVALAVGIAVSVYQSPGNIVRRTAAVPTFASLKFTHGWQRDGLDSGDVWLHFTISPPDLDALLKSEGYTRLPSRNINFEAYRPPSWWNYEKLGSDAVFYQCNNGRMPARAWYDECRKDVVVNQERNEVFFFMQRWYKVEEEER
jgi:hypothetical protein